MSLLTPIFWGREKWIAFFSFSSEKSNSPCGKLANKDEDINVSKV
jgi:hypothetical protein